MALELLELLIVHAILLLEYLQMPSFLILKLLQKNSFALFLLFSLKFKHLNSLHELGDLLFVLELRQSELHFEGDDFLGVLFGEGLRA